VAEYRERVAEHLNCGHVKTEKVMKQMISDTISILLLQLEEEYP